MIADLASSRELFVNLTLRELRGKYKRTALGWGWSLLNPLATMVVFSVVFALVLRVPFPAGAGGVKSFPLYLLCALLPWTFFANVVTAGMTSLLANANLIQKTSFPRELLVLSTAASFAVSFGIEMAVLLVAFLVAGSTPLLYVPPLLVVLALLGCFATGVALALSVLNVYFRDLGHFIGILLQVWFYGTPIVYPLALVKDAIAGHGWATAVHLDVVYHANPMVAVVESVRDLLYSHRLPPAATWAWLAVAGLGTLWAGSRVFTRFEGRLAEEL